MMLYWFPLRLRVFSSPAVFAFPRLDLSRLLKRYMHANTGKMRKSNFHTKARSAAGVKSTVVVPPSSVDTVIWEASFEVTGLSSSPTNDFLWSITDWDALAAKDLLGDETGGKTRWDETSQDSAGRSSQGLKDTCGEILGRISSLVVRLLMQDEVRHPTRMMIRRYCTFNVIRALANVGQVRLKVYSSTDRSALFARSTDPDWNSLGEWERALVGIFLSTVSTVSQAFGGTVLHHKHYSHFTDAVLTGKLEVVGVNWNG